MWLKKGVLWKWKFEFSLRLCGRVLKANVLGNFEGKKKLIKKKWFVSLDTL